MKYYIKKENQRNIIYLLFPLVVKVNNLKYRLQHSEQINQLTKWICFFDVGKNIGMLPRSSFLKLLNSTVTKKGTEISGHRLVAPEQQNKHLQEMFDISRICPCCPMSPRSEKLKAQKNWFEDTLCIQFTLT